MIRLLIALVIIIGLWAAMGHLKRLPPAERKRLLWKLGLWGAGAGLLVLVATGRAHWLFAIVGALLPLAKTALGLGLQFFPLWKQKQQTAGKQPSVGPMSVREAMDTLGLKGDEQALTRDEVVSAHRKLMQKLHPDRGGNDFLAAKVNEAKELLIKRLG
ncbi:molecular chaperone DnaJ [Marinimicrobium locisalis]|uniref:molecular chaperone DnaJ n=1 Tax=Marinimicrobium locisalis TaxID=546022 RepID=UPI003221F724